MGKTFEKIKVGVGLLALATLFAFNLHHAVVYHYGVLNLNFSQNPQVYAQTNSTGSGSDSHPGSGCSSSSNYATLHIMRYVDVYGYVETNHIGITVKIHKFPPFSIGWNHSIRRDLILVRRECRFNLLSLRCDQNQQGIVWERSL